MGSVNTILQANNITHIQKSEYDAKVLLQQSHNKLEASKVTLAEFGRSLANASRAEAAGKEYNEATSQLAASLESRTTGRINSSLAASERVGALMAQAAAAGVGGVSVDMLTETIKLQRNIEQDLQQQTTGRLAAQGSRAAAGIVDDAYSRTDLQRSFGNFNHTIYIAPKRMKRRLGKLIGVAFATWGGAMIGQPQLGESAAAHAVGTWQADNADYAGMTESFDTALTGAAQGFKAWADQNTSWFGAVNQRKNQEAVAESSKEQSIKWGSFSPNDNASYGSGFGEGWDWLFGSGGNDG